MKKTILLTMVMVGMCLGSMAQNAKLRFGSKQNNDAIETWKYVADNNKKDDHEWAKAVYHEFGLNSDDAIQHRYVINATDSFKVSMVMGLTKMWLEKAFSTPRDSIVEFDVDKRIIKAKVYLLGLGDAYGFGGFAATNSEAHVTIPMELTFQFKENRMRYVATISNFILNSSDWVKDVVNQSLPVAKCYPVNSSGKHKDSFSRAFINCNAKCLTSCRDYINYLNTHFGERPQPQVQPKKSADDDW